MTNPNDASEEDGLSLVYRDLLILLALIYMTMAILIVPLIKVTQVEAEASNRTAPAGELVVELTWSADGQDSDSDLDLWVLSPDDEEPVGFRRKVGKSFALLRDDLGKSKTKAPGRFELSASTARASGEYVVAVFPYRLREPEVRATVRLLARKNSGIEVLTEREITFRAGTGEVTAFRFTVRSDGTVAPGSIHHVPKRIVQ